MAAEASLFGLDYPTKGYSGPLQACHLESQKDSRSGIAIHRIRQGQDDSYNSVNSLCFPSHVARIIANPSATQTSTSRNLW